MEETFEVLEIPGEGANWNLEILLPSIVNDIAYEAWGHCSHGNHFSTPHANRPHVSVHGNVPHSNHTPHINSSTPHSNRTVKHHGNSTPHASTRSPHVSVSTPHGSSATPHGDQKVHTDNTPHVNENQHVNT